MNVEVNFRQKQLAYRLAHLQGKNELIAKAIGFKKGFELCVYDTTAGLGTEGFLLAALGCQVMLFERHPTVAALLQAGMNEGLQDPLLAPILARMELREVCAIDYLHSHPQAQPDIIYCDPMFPHRTKSAAVKKPMQFLQTVVGDDPDAVHLVEIALQRAKKRVVVKRARLAPTLFQAPSFSLEARSHRFDVYIIHKK